MDIESISRIDSSNYEDQYTEYKETKMSECIDINIAWESKRPNLLSEQRIWKENKHGLTTFETWN